MPDLRPEVLRDLRAMCEKAVKDYRDGKTVSEGYPSEGHPKVQIVLDTNNLLVVTLLVAPNGQHPFMGFKFINATATVEEMMEWIDENLYPLHLQ